jgi:hypothetical protein
LFYPVDKNNCASRKIPEKLGFFTATGYEKKKNEMDTLHVIEGKINTAVEGSSVSTSTKKNLTRRQL